MVNKCEIVYYCQTSIDCIGNTDKGKCPYQTNDYFCKNKELQKISLLETLQLRITKELKNECHKSN